MVRGRFIAFLISVCSFGQTFAQGIHTNHEHEIDKDTNTLNHFFEKGRFYGHARSYFASTVNEGNLTDYYALGIGAGVGYETPKFLKYFQVGMSGFFMFNVASSDLGAPDPRTGQSSRYEVGLFDIEEPNDHEDLDRLEELFIKIHPTKKTVFTFGRQIPQTPFINPQDGRMRPTLIEGAVLESNEIKNVQLHGEYIFRISPRSTVEWFNIGRSIGIYPSGVTAEGVPANYHGAIHSKGIATIGGIYTKNRWSVKYWNTYVDNIMNTQFASAEWKSPSIAGKSWFVGGQVVSQKAIGQGGASAEHPTRYIEEGEGSLVFSGRIGARSKAFDYYLNATRITGKGRYLMPREWGREPFYTFMPRERNEGFGDVTAVTVNTYWKPEKHIKVELSGGYFQLPDVKNFALNKYGLPTYTQVNAGLTYQFDHFLEGLNLLVLVVRKDQLGETYANDRFVFNKVNMTHFNFIINYHY
ncbi:MAG: OprD family outer membrane porin [Spirosomataceae bacterium]